MEETMEDITVAEEESVDTNDMPEKQEPTAAEKIAKLLQEMRSQKRELLAVMDFCREEHTSEEIDEMLAPYKEHRRSVYDGMAIRSLLEKAGALVYHANDEQPEEVANENGDLVLPEPSVGTWSSTEAAIECCDADDPYGELVKAMNDAQGPAEAYALVLAICDDENQTASAISQRLQESGVLEGDNHDPIYFVSKLEEIEALEWRGYWTTTDLGRRYLAQING
ncbi:MAG: hypothetical protein IKE43_13115 [Coriobacteriales bacterium]|nr:hypothetical protein [Coriobacteriales bacterium]